MTPYRSSNTPETRKSASGWMSASCVHEVFTSSLLLLLICTIWTDDVRYFGTKEMLDEYENELQKHIKVKLLGVPGEFVGVDFNHDLSLGVMHGAKSA
jgi:hypothetical protein